MYCRAALVAAALLLATCARRPGSSTPERIAILRFENLGPDASADWMGRAFSEVIAEELTASPDVYAIPSNRLHSLDAAAGARPASAPGISAERTLALLAGANRAGYGEYFERGGRLQAQLTIEDLQTQKVTALLTASAPAGDVIQAASTLARGISARAGPYGTRNPQALRFYVIAMELGRADDGDLSQAIAADPDFAPPYRLMAQWKLRQQDRAGAIAVLEQALARPATAQETAARAGLELERATLRNDPAAQQRALAALVKLVPRDPAMWRALALLAMSRHQYRESVEAFRKSLAVEPDDVGVLNSFAYASVYAGDFGAAVAALRRYQALRPADANALDSLGDVNLIAGHLREAVEFYLQAEKKNAALLADGDWLKAAMARLMSGDASGADGFAGQYLDARAAAKDPAVEFHGAEWQWVTGRRKEGCRLLAAFARGAESGPMRETASRAYSELAIWSLALGDRAAAAQMAEKAAAISGPSTVMAAAVARFLSQPRAPAAEWSQRAERLFPDSAQSSVRHLVLAYALLLESDFAAAAPLLQQSYEEGANPASDEGLPILLAWTWLETGRAKDAARLLEFNPVPGPAGGGPLHALYFPRFYFLRGMAAAAEGRRDEAQADYKLFLQLSGPDPLMWGEEKKARQ